MGRGLYIRTDEIKKRISDSVKANPVRYWLGKKRLDMIGNLRGFKKGNRPWNWLGGISFEPYGLEFNNKLKEKIRKRDNYTCQECGKKQKELGYKLHIHHIDYNKKNNQEKNLISLCRQCHLKTNFNRKDWTKYFRKKMKK